MSDEPTLLNLGHDPKVREAIASSEADQEFLRAAFRLALAKENLRLTFERWDEFWKTQV